jgi:hypothetical protein
MDVGWTYFQFEEYELKDKVKWQSDMVLFIPDEILLLITKDETFWRALIDKITDILPKS